MSGNFEFYLHQLDMSANQTTDASMQWQNTTIGTVDYSANAVVDVSYNLLQNMFQFYSNDISANDMPTDPVDLKYRVVWSSNAQPLHVDINHNTWVYNNAMGGNTVNGVTVNQLFTLDWIRWLAQELFNTINGVDLFSNEELVRSSLATAFSTDLNTKFLELNNATTVDGSNNGVIYSSNAPNASQSILSQIIGSAPDRLQDLIDTDDAHWFKCPILPNDDLYFRVKIRAKADQHNLTGVASVRDRTYLLKIKACAI
jgi:hypothetical protein